MSSSIFLSIKVAAVATFFVLIIGLSISYLLATKNFKGKTILEVLLTLPLIMPPTVTGYYLIILFGRNGLIGKFIYDITGWTIMFTWQAAALASFIISLPLMIKTTQVAIEAVDKNLINTAYMLGYSEFETTIKIIFPLAKRGIIAGTILSFARSIGEFGATLMLAGNIPGKTDTMPIAIYSYTTSGDWKNGHLLVIILTLISGVFLYLANGLNRRIF